MDHAGRPVVLPLRPLTVGELLDAAVALLRAHARVLVPVAAVLALVEQLLLAPLRMAANAEPPAYLPDFDHFGAYWLLLAVGAGVEVAIIAVLGGPAARAAAAEVVGHRPTARELLRPAGGRFGLVAVLALTAGAVVFVMSLTGPAWIIGYALVGLAVPVLVIDRTGPLQALGRGALLAVRSGLRAAGIRLVGYLAWFAVRIALGLGALAALSAIGADAPGWAVPVAATVWLLVNSLAYPTLACLDAVLLLETRMRTEGLDIALTRARHTGRSAAAILAGGP
ncbi:hypothetical protein [Polymorphospora rubra]|uniref:Integral membrane protein n=1 Tax=Polymorphospora rubra TaxID=338584 RepID=A0A810MTM1_9ACTN|nr:hypothetical protein [Polymorphospora rubra]BCJ64312.1 hypothetical protein Prubr_13330 [Polymorphospora rubra]